MLAMIKIGDKLECDFNGIGKNNFEFVLGSYIYSACCLFIVVINVFPT